MRRLNPAAIVFAASVLVLPGAAPAAAPEIDRAVVGFVRTYCVRCHGPAKQNASLRFDTLAVTLGDEATAQSWQDILDVLNLDEMPPDGEKRPSDEELSSILETLTNNLREARERLHDGGGQMVIRRMNRREYQNTIRSLFGVDVSIDAVPDDATVDGFDTIATAHSFSSLHLERYLSAAETVLAAFVGRGARRSEPQVRRFEPEAVDRSLRAILERDLSRMRELPSVEERAKRGGPIQRVDFEILKHQLITEYLKDPAAKTGVMVPYRGLAPFVKTKDSAFGRSGVYKVRVRCGVNAPEPVDGVFLEVRRVPRQTSNIDHIDCLEVRGTIDNPQTIEFEAVVDGNIGNWISLARRTPRWKVLERFEAYAESDARYLTRTGGDIVRLADDAMPSVWVDWIETEGPFPRFEPSMDRSLVNLPRRATLDDAREMIEKFSFEVFRRQHPSPEYVDRVLKIYEMSRENGADVEMATRECLKVVLASPRFLFLHEPTDASRSRRPLTDRELAVRLSYFLWSGPPDDALYRAAEQGQLGTSQGLAKQMDRMLASQKSEAFIQTFVTQHLELHRLDGIQPESTTAPKYDRALQEASKREVFALFRHLLQVPEPAGAQPATLFDLLDADYVIVNSLMADFYGMPGIHGDHFRRAAAPLDVPRGGLLGQSAILTLTGTGERTSPVERGAYVLRKILNRPPPPAPANVPMLDEDGLGDQSIRETLRVHMTKPQCSSCHRRIDPLGFGLENFDPVGLWRETVLSADAEQQFPIEPAGKMPDGQRAFAGPRELKERIMEDRDAFLVGLTKALMTYGIGRKVGYADALEVEKVVAATAKNGYSLRALLHEIVKSPPFQTK